MSNRLGAALTLGYAIIADLIISAGVPPAVAAVCVVPLVLFAPGYSCVLALEIPGDARLPGRRVVLAVALSMGFVALGGLILNALGPLDEASWSEWLVGVTCAFAIAALARDLYDEGRFSVPTSLERPRWVGAFSWPTVVCAIVAVLALAAGVLLTETSAHSQYDKPVTQLALLPATTSSGNALRLTVTNLSNRTRRVILTVARGAGVRHATTLAVAPSKTWSRMEPANAGDVQASLTLPGAQRAFTQVAWNG